MALSLIFPGAPGRGGVLTTVDACKKPRGRAGLFRGSACAPKFLAALKCAAKKLRFSAFEKAENRRSHPWRARSGVALSFVPEVEQFLFRFKLGGSSWFSLLTCNRMRLDLNQDQWYFPGRNDCCLFHRVRDRRQAKGFFKNPLPTFFPRITRKKWSEP